MPAEQTTTPATNTAPATPAVKPDATPASTAPDLKPEAKPENKESLAWARIKAERKAVKAEREAFEKDRATYHEAKALVDEIGGSLSKREFAAIDKVLEKYGVSFSDYLAWKGAQIPDEEELTEQQQLERKISQTVEERLKADKEAAEKARLDEIKRQNDEVRAAILTNVETLVDDPAGSWPALVVERDAHAEIRDAFVTKWLQAGKPQWSPEESTKVMTDLLDAAQAFFEGKAQRYARKAPETPTAPASAPAADDAKTESKSLTNSDSSGPTTPKSKRPRNKYVVA